MTAPHQKMSLPHSLHVLGTKKMSLPHLGQKKKVTLFFFFPYVSIVASSLFRVAMSYILNDIATFKNVFATLINDLATLQNEIPTLFVAKSCFGLANTF
jgi:hypothetical protein